MRVNERAAVPGALHASASRVEKSEARPASEDPKRRVGTWNRGRGRRNSWSALNLIPRPILREISTVSPTRLSRRQACQIIAGVVSASLTPALAAARERRFRLRHILASCMYGKTRLAEILPQVRKCGAEHVDIWPLVHGDQREQVEEMGHERFSALLEKHGVRLGIITQYKLGPFALAPEMRVAKKLGARLLITGSRGPRNLEGKELKAAVKRFVEELKPHAAAAERLGVKIGIENHGGALIRSPDSQRWFAEYSRKMPLGIALAPYHLPQDPKMMARLIEDLGPGLLHVYAWQHGKGCHEKLPKDEELLQMPGRGSLDFQPLVAALEKIDYRGWTEIFMHPVPRGIPILESTEKVTAEINRARKYLESCVGRARG